MKARGGRGKRPCSDPRVLWEEGKEADGRSCNKLTKGMIPDKGKIIHPVGGGENDLSRRGGKERTDEEKAVPAKELIAARINKRD